MFKRGVIGISYLWKVHIFCGDIFYTFAGVYIEISLIKNSYFQKKNPPKNTKSGHSSTNSSCGEEPSAMFSMPFEKQEVAQKPPSLRSFSQGDNVEKETPFALDSMPKSWSQKQPENSLDGLVVATTSKKTSSSSSIVIQQLIITWNLNFSVVIISGGTC
jgi:hypothetical protein